MSSLPKISYPINDVKIPSLNKSFKFRPFLVKEEKLLLMAKESQTPSDILQAIKQVVNNCSIDIKFDADRLAIFDLEYIFLRLRAMSVDNVVKVTYKDYEDEKNYDFDIDLNKVEVDFPKEFDNKVVVTDKSGIILKYPSASLYDDKEFINSEKDYLFELIVRCVDKIYENENVFEAKDYSLKEIREFLENLDVKTFDKIREFLLNLPKLKYVIEYKNSLGNDRKIELNSLNDFFTLR